MTMSHKFKLTINNLSKRKSNVRNLLSYKEGFKAAIKRVKLFIRTLVNTVLKVIDIQNLKLIIQDLKFLIIYLQLRKN